MKLFFFVFVFLFITTPLLQAQEVTSPGFGKGILEIMSKDSTLSMNFSGRFQGLYTSEWEEFEDNESITPDSQSFMIRRARLKFSGFAYSPRLKYKLELGLSNRDISGASIYNSNAPRYIYDAVVQWNFYQNFELWAGQTKLPGNRERIISSGDLQFVDRSLLNSRYNIDRDVGIQLRHYFNPSGKIIIREMFALSQGEGRNITAGNLGGLQYTARFEILPLGLFKNKGDYSGSDLRREDSPKLAIAAVVDYNKDAVLTRSNMGEYMITAEGFYNTDITTYFIDAMFKYRGFSFMGEYSRRDTEEPVAYNLDGTPTGDVVNVGSGLNIQAGYLLKNNMEFSGRYTSINPDFVTGLVDEKQYTLGVSKYFVGHKLKIQTDISYMDYHMKSDENIIYRLQFDIHF